MIYLASPYTARKLDGSFNRQRIAWNYDAAVKVVAQLTSEGRTVYSPIVHYHVPADRYNLPGDFEYWAKHNKHILTRCDALYALTIAGWRKSQGVQTEISWAQELAIPVFMYDLINKEVYSHEAWTLR